MTQRQRERRRQIWLRLTSLPPPDERGFVPAHDGDERPAQLDRDWERYLERCRRIVQKLRRDQLLPWLHQSCNSLGLRENISDPNQDYAPLRPTWSIAATPDDTSPSWHNVVRAYEEDR